jgi:predicted GIY-YIG superfamily endonuclease
MKLTALLSKNVNHQYLVKSATIEELKHQLNSVSTEEQLKTFYSKLNKDQQRLSSKLYKVRDRKLRSHDLQPKDCCEETSIDEISSKNNRKKKNRRKRKNRKHSVTNTNATVTNTVVNISNLELTDAEIKLLSKGLSFCPRPKTYDRGKLKNDTEEFIRRLRLKAHFALQPTNKSKENISCDQPTFRKKSNWTPPKSSIPNLEAFINSVENDTSRHINHTNKYSNLTKEETDALHSLKSRTDIIIKPADKGSAVVVMNREDYISEASRQLSDARFYQKLDHDPTLEYAKIITNVIDEAYQSGHIDQQTKNYLSPENPRAGRFYLLPKIHKQGNPGRPIISGNGHPTERISEYLDHFMRPHVHKLPSYLQDTTDYLIKSKASEPLLPDTLLASLDVTSLYTNIPHNEGLQACSEAWETRTVNNPPTHFLVQLLELVLKLNNFEFNEENYLQINGTAMGTKMAPSYANIFMGKLEGQLLASVERTPYQWVRFIDDIEMKWQYGRESLDDFISKANNFHPSIKFTAEISNSNHVFLDTTTRLVENKLHTDIYSKPTDKHQYLLPTSCHPKHCIKNIPYSQALRIRRICSDDERFLERSEELAKHLIYRGYDKDLIAEAIQRAKQTNRDDLLRYGQKEKVDRIPFILTYHPDNPKVGKIIANHWPTVQSSDILNLILPNKPVVAYRRPKNLKDILVRAKLTPIASQNQPSQSGPCGDKRCKTCQHMIETKTFTSTVTKEKLNIHGPNKTCKTENVIYLITCKICGLQYVGETEKLHKRINLHRSDWMTKKLYRSPVAEHFSSPGHTFSDIILIAIANNHSWSSETRKEKESYWIRRLRTLKPSGLNQED